MANKRVGFIPAMGWLRNWWQADRIRVSPNQGRLMHIQPPALLEIAEKQWIIQSRHQDSINSQAMIRYVCVNDADINELWVFVPNSENWQSKLLWVCGNDSHSLEESSVTVYPLSLKFPESAGCHPFVLTLGPAREVLC